MFYLVAKSNWLSNANLMEWWRILNKNYISIYIVISIEAEIHNKNLYGTWKHTIAQKYIHTGSRLHKPFDFRKVVDILTQVKWRYSNKNNRNLFRMIKTEMLSYACACIPIHTHTQWWRFVVVVVLIVSCIPIFIVSMSKYTRYT